VVVKFQINLFSVQLINECNLILFDLTIFFKIDIIKIIVGDQNPIRFRFYGLNKGTCAVTWVGRQIQSN